MNGCDQCEVLTINGVACHETGCPNSHLDPVTNKPLERECDECGQRFTPDEGVRANTHFCDSECSLAYSGYYGSDGES